MADTSKHFQCQSGFYPARSKVSCTIRHLDPPMRRCDRETSRRLDTSRLFLVRPDRCFYAQYAYRAIRLASRAKKVGRGRSDRSRGTVVSSYFGLAMAQLVIVASSSSGTVVIVDLGRFRAISGTRGL